MLLVFFYDYSDGTTKWLTWCQAVTTVYDNALLCRHRIAAEEKSLPFHQVYYLL